MNWETFFDEHAPRYMENAFTGNTRFEVEFLVETLDLEPGTHILDIGCGTGRHSVGLAALGFQVTGIDLSAGMLAQARIAAETAGVNVTWIHADAATFQPEIYYDGVICICEGGLGLSPTDRDPIAHDLAILQMASKACRPNGRFIMTCLNGYHAIRQMTDEAVEAGAFDPATMLAQYIDEWDLPEGKRQVPVRERQLIPPEVVAMLRHVGFNVEAVWGGTAGEWGRRPLKLDEIEAMYVSRRA